MVSGRILLRLFSSVSFVIIAGLDVKPAKTVISSKAPERGFCFSGHKSITIGILLLALFDAAAVEPPFIRYNNAI